MNKVHFTGPIAHEHGSRLGGWPVCCSGDRSVSLKRSGFHTDNSMQVTCSNCLKQMELHANYWNDPARSQSSIDYFKRENSIDPRAVVYWRDNRITRGAL